jgi:protein-disulfide isomerase
MNRTILVAALAAIAVTIGAYAYLSPPDQATSLLPVSAANAQDTVEVTDVDTSAIIEMTLGDPEAPITVIEYASFTCPHCRSFHETVFPQLEENFIDTGLGVQGQFGISASSNCYTKISPNGPSVIQRLWPKI